MPIPGVGLQDLALRALGSILKRFQGTTDEPFTPFQHRITRTPGFAVSALPGENAQAVFASLASPAFTARIVPSPDLKLNEILALADEYRHLPHGVIFADPTRPHTLAHEATHALAEREGLFAPESQTLGDVLTNIPPPVRAELRHPFYRDLAIPRFASEAMALMVEDPRVGGDPMINIIKNLEAAGKIKAASQLRRIISGRIAQQRAGGR